MSAPWREDEEDLRPGGVRVLPLKSKPRFSFHEVKVLLEAVKRNRYIILRKFNRGVSVETKKQTWTEITNQINDLGENHREVRQIMKKWADLKCDGKRRLLALRKPDSGHLRKRNMGPVEKMVHKILMMSPAGNGDSDFDLCEDEDFPKAYSATPPPNPSPYSYLSLTDSSHSVPERFSFDMSPLSSPEDEAGGDPFQSSSEFDVDLAEDGEHSMDFDDNEDSIFSSYPSSLPPPPPSSTLEKDPLSDTQLRIKPVHTYSRNIGQTNSSNHVQNHTSSSRPPPGPSSSSSVASTSSALPPASDSDAGSSTAVPPPPRPPPTSSTSSASFVPPLPPPSSSSSSTSNSTSQATPSSSSIPPPPPPASTSTTAPSSSNSHRPSSSSSSSSTIPSKQSPAPSSCDPLPAGASSRRPQDHVSQMASQSLQQQRASRMLLTSVSQSLEVLAQSVQLLVESQQEFVQESLLLQRETVDVLRDFSNTALTMLRDKANSGQVPRHHHHPASHY